MTRINVVPVLELTDQHLMAEYRELPMVMTSARRANLSAFKPSTTYTLNKGHVSFFYDKRKYLLNRWMDLIAELFRRGYDIDPTKRTVHWKELDKFAQVCWMPDQTAIAINRARIQERIAAKPTWYRMFGRPLT